MYIFSKFHGITKNINQNSSFFRYQQTTDVCSNWADHRVRIGWKHKHTSVDEKHHSTWISQQSLLVVKEVILPSMKSILRIVLPLQRVELVVQMIPDLTCTFYLYFHSSKYVSSLFLLYQIRSISVFTPSNTFFSFLNNLILMIIWFYQCTFIIRWSTFYPISNTFYRFLVPRISTGENTFYSYESLC